MGNAVENPQIGAADESIDGIARYSTRIKVIVHSHTDRIAFFLGDDVENCNVSKVIKGPGNAQVTLTGSQNFLNIVQPNDVINIYFDKGDGEGWTRTFFGYVDRVEETLAVGGDGKTITRYVLSCTDFMKAMMRTQIYFNPQVANRRDFVGDFIGAPNIGGLALQMKGLAFSGTPSSMILNLIFLLFGFGSQFVMPESYAQQAQRAISALRRERFNFLKKSLPEDIRRQFIDEGGTLEEVREAAQVVAATQLAFEISSGSSPYANMTEEDKQNLLRSMENQFIQREFRNDFQLLSRVAHILETTKPSAQASLLDVMDPITFVEEKAMDGYLASASVWQKQGPVFNFLMSHCNENINEMIFDLRAVTEDASGPDLLEVPFSRDMDELEGNRADSPSQRDGVKYVPALVLREYPFSTIDNIDGSNVSVLDGNLGVLHFGAIFSNRPNVAGRHIIEIPSINIEDRAAGNNTAVGRKHLDVAVISEKEIISHSLGRSDNDHFNLTEFWSDSVLGSDARFFLNDIIPVTSPIHIVRHGLRVRQITTRFARYSLGTISKATETAPETPADAPSDTPEEVLADAGFVIGEHPNPADIPNTRNWRALTTLASAYGVGLNVYLLARTIFSEYGFEDVSSAVHPGNLIPAWSAVNIARTGYRPGGGRKAFAITDTGEKIYQTTNVGLALMGSSGEIGRFGGRRPQGTARFVGDVPNPADPGNSATTTQRAALQGRFRLSLTPDEQALANKYFDLARQVLSGAQADPAPAGATITFIHLAPSESPDPSKVSSLAARNYQMYEIEAAPGKGLKTVAWAALDADTTEETMTQEEEPAPEPATPVEQPGPTAGAIDTALTRSQLIRWALLHDHWYQHNLEYLNGRIKMRGAPEIRVGYRLDIFERGLSFYVEGVQHSWSYPNTMETTLQVTRGQPNDPYPMHVFPASDAFDAPAGQRHTKSRLSQYFVVPDLAAIHNALILRQGGFHTPPPAPASIDDDVDAFEDKVLLADTGDIDREEAVRELYREGGANDDLLNDQIDAQTDTIESGIDSDAFVSQDALRNRFS